MEKLDIQLTVGYSFKTYLSNALTLPRSFLLFLQLISTCVLFFTDCVRTDRGPVLNSSSSLFWSSSGVISDLGLFNKLLKETHNYKSEMKPRVYTAKLCSLVTLHKRWIITVCSFQNKDTLHTKTPRKAQL